MEQAQYLTVMMNKKHILNSQFQASTGGGFLSSNSWEEQAFAEDAAGVLGGCVWPPRSYSCSFCRREFKSAQALGGHMNIHRRDRAKLKQTLSPHNDETDHQVSPPGPAFVSSSLSPSAVYNDQHSSFVVSSLLRGHRNRNGTTSPPPAIKWSDSLAVTTLVPPTSVVSDSDSKAKLQKHPTKQEETHLSASLSSVTRRNRSSSDEEEDEEEEETMLGSKRPKTVVFSVSLPFFLNPCSQQSWSQPEARGPKPTSTEDTIDLELRLGHMPKVK